MSGREIGGPYSLNPYESQLGDVGRESHLGKRGDAVEYQGHTYKHHGMDGWRLKRLVAAVAITLFTGCLALVFSKVRDLWKAALSGEEKPSFSAAESDDDLSFSPVRRAGLQEESLDSLLRRANRIETSKGNVILEFPNKEDADKLSLHLAQIGIKGREGKSKHVAQHRISSGYSDYGVVLTPQDEASLIEKLSQGRGRSPLGMMEAEVVRPVVDNPNMLMLSGLITDARQIRTLPAKDGTTNVILKFPNKGEADKLSQCLEQIGIKGRSGKPKYVTQHRISKGDSDYGVVLTPQDVARLAEMNLTFRYLVDESVLESPAPMPVYESPAPVDVGGVFQPALDPDSLARLKYWVENSTQIPCQDGSVVFEWVYTDESGNPSPLIAQEVSGTLAQLGIKGGSGNPKYVAQHMGGSPNFGVVLTPENIQFLQNFLYSQPPAEDLHTPVYESHAPVDVGGVFQPALNPAEQRLSYLMDYATTIDGIDNDVTFELPYESEGGVQGPALAQEVRDILAQLGIKGGSGNPKYVAQHNRGRPYYGVVLTHDNLRFLQARGIYTHPTLPENKSVYGPPAPMPLPEYPAPMPVYESPASHVGAAMFEPQVGVGVSQPVTWDDLVAKSGEFASRVKAMPTSDNSIVRIAGTSEAKRAEVVAHANATRSIMHSKTRELIQNFLLYKLQYGSDVEKRLYTGMSEAAFIDRLLKKRPLMFMNGSDDYISRDGTRGSGGFEKIGTDAQRSPFVLDDYMSYEEIQVAALLGVSVPTHFINDGDRGNSGRAGGVHEEKGVYQGLVGARFEKPELMEYQHMLITPHQNTTDKGYGAVGAGTAKGQSMAHWAKFYGVDHFPTYEEADAAVRAGSSDYIKTSRGYLNVKIYKQRMKAAIEMSLLDANQRAAEAGTKAYVHAVGLGIGVWAVDGKEQAKIMYQAYAEVMTENSLSHISDIDFSWFPTDDTPAFAARVGAPADFNGIKIHFSKRNPAEKLTGADEGKLLVAQYAWDGGSFPGNEYWNSMLTASGDPAAACCSTIPELQNPYVNPMVSGGNVHFMGAVRV